MIYHGYQLPKNAETLAFEALEIVIEKLQKFIETGETTMHDLEWQEKGHIHRLEQHPDPRQSALYIYYRNGQIWDVGTPECLSKAHDFTLPTIRVRFVIFQKELTALFPDEIADNAGNITCYAQIGQHGAARRSLMRCKRATKAEYKDLLRELTQIYAPTALTVI